MPRGRKTRTHDKGAQTASTANGTPGAPKSFVVKQGAVGHSIGALARDMRKVMEPNTATRLKERTRNKMKDYLVMGPALQVTHILAFALAQKAPTLKIIRLPSGPTLSFRIERYSLMKDVLNSKKRKRSIGMEYLTPPLLVLSSFPKAGPGTPPHLPLLMKSFESMFPPLSPQTMALPSCRRVVLVHYNADRDTVDFRHFLITVRAQGISKRVRKLLEVPKSRAGSVLDLGGEKDVADYILKLSGYVSESSAASDAGEEEENRIELVTDYVGRNNRKGERRTVRLDEVGPRMELSLLKVAEGMPGKEGAVMWNRFIKKSKTQIKALEKEHAAKAKLRAQRRAEQEANVARKKAAVGSKDHGGAESDSQDEDDEDEEGTKPEEEVEDEWQDDDFSDAEEQDGSEDESTSEDDDSDMEHKPTPKRKRV